MAALGFNLVGSLPLLYSFLDNWELGWLPVVILAVITVIIIYTVLFMFARALKMNELERESKSEMLQAAATALMAIFLVLIIGSVMTFASGFIQGDLQCKGGTKSLDSIDSAIDAIRTCRILDRAKQIADIQGAVCTGSSTWSLFTTQGLDLSFFGITVFKGSWVPSIYKEVENRRLINMFATTILISLNAQSFLLLYIKNTMLMFFLPLGLILRSFKYTRSIGALFMALAIGLYFIFPVIFILLDPGFTPGQVPESPSVVKQDYCYPSMSSAAVVLDTAEKSGASTGFSNLSISDLTKAFSKTYISLILHPLVAFMITLVFIRYIMVVLGGDTYELVKLVTKVI